MNHLSSQYTFSAMPEEIIDMFFSFVAEQDDDCAKLRMVDSKCKAVLDNHLKTCWERLKSESPEGLVDLSGLMERIEGEKVQGRSALDSNPCFLFQRLAGEFTKLGAALPAGRLPTAPADYADLQNQIDGDALMAIWRKINAKLELPVELNTPKEVLAWLGNPDNAGHLDSIAELLLICSGIRRFPAVVAKFKKLQNLRIIGNHITALPRTIGSLTQLQLLSLGFNQIASLPKEIGKLSQLKELSFCHNPLTSLPEELDDLSQLESLHLQNTSLLFLPPRILNSNISGIRNNPEIVNFKKGLADPCASPLGRLFQSIMKNAAEAKVKARFDALSEEERELIFEMVCVLADLPQADGLEWGKQHAFEDMTRFYLAVRTAIFIRFDRLSEEGKIWVYSMIFQFSKERDAFDECWGAIHVFDNLPFLADAVTVASSYYSQSD